MACRACGQALQAERLDEFAEIASFDGGPAELANLSTV
jgi:hypothetical protein